MRGEAKKRALRPTSSYFLRILPVKKPTFRKIGYFDAFAAGPVTRALTAAVTSPSMGLPGPGVPALLWADLTPAHLERLDQTSDEAGVRSVLVELFRSEEPGRQEVLLELFSNLLTFARAHALSAEKTSTLFSVVKRTHDEMVDVHLGADSCWEFFKALLLAHSVPRPPVQVAPSLSEDDEVYTSENRSAPLHGTRTDTCHERRDAGDRQGRAVRIPIRVSGFRSIRGLEGQALPNQTRALPKQPRALSNQAGAAAAVLGRRLHARRDEARLRVRARELLPPL